MHKRKWQTITEQGRVLYNDILPNRQDLIIGTLSIWRANMFDNDGLDNYPTSDTATSDIRYVALGIVRQMHQKALLNLTEKQLQFCFLLAYVKLADLQSWMTKGKRLGIGYNLTRGHYTPRYHCKVHWMYHCSAIADNRAAIEIHRTCYNRYGRAVGVKLAEIFALSNNGQVLASMEVK